jgi:hypothetical protein
MAACFSVAQPFEGWGLWGRNQSSSPDSMRPLATSNRGKVRGTGHGSQTWKGWATEKWYPCGSLAE